MDTHALNKEKCESCPIYFHTHLFSIFIFLCAYLYLYIFHPSFSNFFSMTKISTYQLQQKKMQKIFFLATHGYKIMTMIYAHTPTFKKILWLLEPVTHKNQNKYHNTLR